MKYKISYTNTPKKEKYLFASKVVYYNYHFKFKDIKGFGTYRFCYNNSVPIYREQTYINFMKPFSEIYNNNIISWWVRENREIIKLKFIELIKNNVDLLLKQNTVNLKKHNKNDMYFSYDFNLKFQRNNEIYKLIDYLISEFNKNLYLIKYINNFDVSKNREIYNINNIFNLENPLFLNIYIDCFNKNLSNFNKRVYEYVNLFYKLSKFKDYSDIKNLCHNINLERFIIERSLYISSYFFADKYFINNADIYNIQLLKKESFDIYKILNSIKSKKMIKQVNIYKFFQNLSSVSIYEILKNKNLFYFSKDKSKEYINLFSCINIMKSYSQAENTLFTKHFAKIIKQVNKYSLINFNENIEKDMFYYNIINFSDKNFKDINLYNINNIYLKKGIKAISDFNISNFLHYSQSKNINIDKSEKLFIYDCIKYGFINFFINKFLNKDLDNDLNLKEIFDFNRNINLLNKENKDISDNNKIEFFSYDKTADYFIDYIEKYFNTERNIYTERILNIYNNDKLKILNTEKINLLEKYIYEFYMEQAKEAAKEKGIINIDNIHELKLWQRFWFLKAGNVYDKKILPYYDYPYEDKPIKFEGFDDLNTENWQVVYPYTFWKEINFYPVKEGSSLGKNEIDLAVNIMIEFINIIILLWSKYYKAFWGWTGTQAVLGITTSVYEWINLETSRLSQDLKQSRKHYNRCYRWLRWEAEKVSLIARNDMELRGNYYVEILIHEMISYMENHHFNTMPIFEDINKMDEWRNMFDRDLQEDIKWILDKVKGIRHKMIIGKEEKENV